MMDEGAQCFMKELEREIGNHPNKADIIAEIQVHIYHILEENKTHHNSYQEIAQRLGTPRDIAKMWKQENSITPRKTQWLFILCNVAIFVGGALLTLFYNIFHWQWLEQLWFTLTDAPIVIIVLYVLFWGLLGYEIGREFGHRGQRLLKRTFIISIIPNLLLMYLIIFRVLPYAWFEPLLNMPFIVLCFIFTALLYPVSWLGYRWGRKVSV